MIAKFGIHLKVKDINKSLAFYKSFDLKPVFAYGNKVFLSQFKNIPTVTEKYRGVTFDVNGALIEIADGHLAIKLKVFQETIFSSKISAMLYVKSVNEVVKICNKNNYEIAVPIQEFPWGTKEVVVIDSDGFVLVFIERVASLP